MTIFAGRSANVDLMSKCGKYTEPPRRCWGMNRLSVRCPNCGKWLEVEHWEANNLDIAIWVWCECGRFFDVAARVELGIKEVLRDD